MAQRRIKYPLLWLAFVATMVTGAALIGSRDATRQAIGLALLVGPVALFALAGAVYYLLERFRARTGR